MKKLFYSLIFALAFVSCTKEMDENALASNNSPYLSLSVASTSRTADIKKEWKVGDTIAVYAALTGADASEFIYLVSDATTGALTPLVAANSLVKMNYVSIQAFYPYNSSLNYDGYKARLDNYDYSNIYDIMSTESKSISANDASVTLSFKHELAAVIFKFTVSEEFDLSDISTDASVTLNDGTKLSLNLKETDGSYMADSIFVKASASLENTNLMFSF
ncbi:MAG: fimbrillin family protein, partial [Rikenellaceae bacterium]